MRILIIDDSAANREAAQEQLEGHELIFASSYDEAQRALTPRLDYVRAKKRLEELLEAAGFSCDSKQYRNTDKWDAFLEAHDRFDEQASEEMTEHPHFDAVLSDLMMPPSLQLLADPREFADLELPLGTFLVLLAMRAGVKKVGLVTDTNHHHHPASAAVDAFRPWDGGFAVGDTMVVCWNRGKSWAEVLKLLTVEKSG